MNEWAGFFLGVIALTATIQCVFMVVAALSLQKTGRDVKELCEKLDRQLKPVLEELKQGATNFKAVSDIAHDQMQRVEGLLNRSISSVETTVDEVRSMVQNSLSTANLITAFWDGLRQGLDRFRGSSARRSGSTGRRSEESDEHLFIG